MKKSFLIILMAVIMAVALCSCDNKRIEMQISWNYYSDAQELLEEKAGNLVFTGKITGISFAVLDRKTGLAPTKETEDRDRELCTLYEVEIITIYKGDASDVTCFRVMGGLRDYRTDEQRKIMKKNKAYGWKDAIPLLPVEDELKCEIGETYLFVLHKFEGGSAPTYLNPQQSLYALNDPLTGQGYLDYKISIKDILSELGQETWDSFWSQWLEQHPDYQE
ncbi:MAG: hypothetical protein FWD39_05215 [Clostridiales bacterium]|nr:hypothetical protein [Clostridiales bacterium]